MKCIIPLQGLIGLLSVLVPSPDQCIDEDSKRLLYQLKHKTLDDILSIKDCHVHLIVPWKHLQIVCSIPLLFLIIRKYEISKQWQNDHIDLRIYSEWAFFQLGLFRELPSTPLTSHSVFTHYVETSRIVNWFHGEGQESLIDDHVESPIFTGDCSKELPHRVWEKNTALLWTPQNQQIVIAIIFFVIQCVEYVSG